MSIRKKTALINRLALLLIRGYQKYISRLCYGSCRFYPTCSQYAMVSMHYHSFFKALYLIIKRLSKCHQYHPGGFDYPKVCIDDFNNISYRQHITKSPIKAWLVCTNQDTQDTKELYYIANFTSPHQPKESNGR